MSAAPPALETWRRQENLVLRSMADTKTKLGLALILMAFPMLLALAPASAQVEPCDPALACFDVRLSPDTLIGDFYLDGALVAAGVNSARLVGAPDTPHLIEARNIQEPGAAGFNDLYNYPDQGVVQQTKPGWIWRVIFYSQKNFLKGTLMYFCDPRGRAATDSVACRPTIDGATQPDVAAGASAAYNLAPGAHAVHTDLVGDQAGNWAPTARDDAVNVVGGRTTRLTALFLLKGLLKISLWPAGITADIFVDGALVAAQAGAVDVFVAPGDHTVEARNVTDPAAGGNYRYGDKSAPIRAFAAGTRTLVLRPTKTWLTGTLSVLCQIYRKTPADDAQCVVSADGAQLGTVAAAARGTFTLPVGAHTIGVSLAGASASRWSGAVSASTSIFGGRTTYYTARFSLLPSAPPPPASNPAPLPVGGGGAPGGFELGGQVSGFSRPDLMQSAGMVWVKRQVRWHPGAAADAGLINDAHAKGFKILLSVLGEPGDIAGGANFDDYARFVGQLAGMGADAIEVWNEMNIDREWPMGEIDPARYVDLLRRAYTQIKANNPNTMVISGAPAPTGAEGAFGLARVWNDDRYIAGMAAAGAANYMDCLGVHYNEGIVSPTQSSGDPRDNYFTRYYSGMVSTYFNAFGGRKKLCFTELGYLSPEGYGPLPPAFGWGGDTSVAEQAQWLAEAVSLARASGIVRMIIVFNVDFTVYGDDPQAGFAIIRPGGGCPACDALRGVTGGR
jgi:hypothetical protein